ncbi:iron complex transport system permease protein [Hathewaya proteolytica DSM 3090]|uniref:Iron complex transport system permease protein n=1 Tax=Hathewaya proteolytica DSM 3090 TaxID=1121331 RepID=A0A1M6KMJ6_9CLOT|nr:iron ABC transporter permease [Hathewaya proteolytica]SHJ60127.1 iron complex transport system permease protein [Hathewaya proteolytica DSM 3090]
MDFIQKSKIRVTLTFVMLTLVLIASFILCIAMGSVRIGAREVVHTLLEGAGGDSTYNTIIWSIRFPRAIASIIGGCSLAAAGLLLQIFFKNPIVEPYVLGVSSGATLFVALVMLGGFSLGITSMSSFAMFLGAFCGSLVVMVIVILFASRVKNVVTLLVIGMMTGYICSGVTSILTVFADKEKIKGFSIWTMGSFGGFTWEQVKVLCIIAIPALLLSMFLVKPLNAFLLGEEYAKSMGINIKLFRISVVTIASLLAAAVTAFAGPVGFIGLAVPQIARLTFRTADNKILVPGTMLLGGIVTCLCDLISRTVLSPMELPISSITAFIGAPVVIVLILRRKTTL